MVNNMAFKLFKKEDDKSNTGIPSMESKGVLQSHSNQMSMGIQPPSLGDGIRSPMVPSSSNLADIKSQVSAPYGGMHSSAFGVSNQNVPSQQTQTPNFAQQNNPFQNQESQADFGNDIDMSDDSLFDFSDLNLKDLEHDSSEVKESNQSQPSDVAEQDEDLSFIKNKKRIKESDKDYFITAKQFKDLLEIVDSVKNRVKLACDSHLRLMDIKSEEDVEFEKLRKDFEYIEDKLYEVDSIIFDR